MKGKKDLANPVGKAPKTSIFLQTTAPVIAFCSSFKQKSEYFQDWQGFKLAAPPFCFWTVEHALCIARFWLRVRGVSQSSSVAQPK